jgi:hypothetical protein
MDKSGSTQNNISGHVNGPVVQGRDFGVVNNTANYAAPLSRVQRIANDFYYQSALDELTLQKRSNTPCEIGLSLRKGFHFACSS